jgi:hypothetical protein
MGSGWQELGVVEDLEAILSEDVAQSRVAAAFAVPDMPEERVKSRIMLSLDSRIPRMSECMAASIPETWK